MKKLCMLLAVMLGMVFVTGCGTMRGMGEDVEHVGDAVQDATN